MVGGRQLHWFRMHLKRLAFNLVLQCWVWKCLTQELFVSNQNRNTGLEASLEFITDNIGFNSRANYYSQRQNTGEFSEDTKTLGTYWYGYNETIFTLSGPLFTPQIKFFGLFNYNFIGDQNPQPLQNYLGEITDPATGTTINLEYPSGARLNSWHRITPESFIYLWLQPCNFQIDWNIHC